MAALGLLCLDPEDRQKLTLMAGEAGHLVHAAGRLAEAVEVLRENRPRMMLLVDGPDLDAAQALREVLRISPLMPVVVALKRRDAGRAVSLMRTGAAEVVAPPWTKEGLQSCLLKTMRGQGTAFSIVQAPARRSGAALFFLAAVVFFGAAFGTSAYRRRERMALEASQVRTSWDLPYKHPAGMAFDVKDLCVADWFSQSFYAHDPGDRSIRRMVHLTAQMPTALSFAGDTVWSSAASGAVFRHMKDATFKVLETYRGAAPHAGGLAYDGLYLWTSDPVKKRISKRLTDPSLSVIATYPYPGSGEPAALVFDGTALWSLDSLNHQLLRHNLERPDEATGRFDLPEYASGGYKPAGVAWDGRRFWTVGEKLPRGSGPARLFQHAEAKP